MNKLNDIVFANIYNKLDLHGESRDIARVAINDFIDDNIKMQNEIIVIVHGIGKGLLREETHNTLKNNKNVLYFKQDNYNEGQTLVQLRSDIMQKNGFTLTEILAVVVILSLLMLIVAPNLLNSVKKRGTEVSETQKQMIIDAADLYIDNTGTTDTCISVSKLKAAGYLNDSISDVTDNNSDFDNAGVRVTYHESSHEITYTDNCS